MCMYFLINIFFFSFYVAYYVMMVRILLFGRDGKLCFLMTPFKLTHMVDFTPGNCNVFLKLLYQTLQPNNTN